MHLKKKALLHLDGSNRKEIIEKVEHGTVIFTAHGVSPEIRKIADEKGLVSIDATCPDVTSTHTINSGKRTRRLSSHLHWKKGASRT